MNARRLAVLTLAVVSIAGAAMAQEAMTRGDVVVAAETQMIMCPTPPPTALYSHDLAFKSYVWTGGAAMAFDSIGVLYSVSDTTLESFDSLLRTIRTVHLQEPSRSMAVDAAGFAYVVGESARVYVYTPGGVFQRGFTLPNVTAPVGAISIDVTPDGCTLVYVGDHAAVNRFDACGQMSLPAIAADERFDAVRAMSDGGFAGATGDRIKFYDSMGRLLYDVLAPPFTPVTTMVFDVDPQYLWIGTNKQLVRMGIIDRSITAKSGPLSPYAVAVAGERRATAAALPEAAPPRRRGSRH
jgi:hypothetical protein